MDYLSIKSLLTRMDYILLAILIFFSVCFYHILEDKSEKKSLFLAVCIILGTGSNILISSEGSLIIQKLIFPFTLLIIFMFYANNLNEKYQGVWLKSILLIVLIVYLFLSEYHRIAQALGTFTQYTSSKLFNSFSYSVHLVLLFAAWNTSVLYLNELRYKGIRNDHAYFNQISSIIVALTGWSAFVVIYQLREISIFQIISCILPALIIQISIFNLDENRLSEIVKKISPFPIIILLAVLYFFYYNWGMLKIILAALINLIL
jgi:hypothetical protein